MITAVAILVAAAIFCLLLGLEQNMLLVCRQEIPLSELPVQWDGCRIVQISDLHHRHSKDILEKTAMAKPDLIMITGDLVSRDFSPEKSSVKVGNFLHGLRKIAPVYYCAGNHELDLMQRREWQNLRCILESQGCCILENRTVTLTRGGAAIDLAGITLRSGHYKNENHYRNLASYTYEEMEMAIGRRQRFTILLAHNPLMLETYAAWGADLVLSGHVHGGIARIPGVGGVLSPERRFFPRYDKGLYQNCGTYLYVSGGVGKFRINVPPEINVIQLKSVKR